VCPVNLIELCIPKMFNLFVLYIAYCLRLNCKRMRCICLQGKLLEAKAAFYSRIGSKLLATSDGGDGKLFSELIKSSE